MTPPSAGTRFGSYELIARIGAGGMGEVYKARDRKLDRDVAVKVLPEGFAADADRLMRFTREAKTLASLNHPHIAHIYDAGREGSTAYIAMELVDGDDLAARIAGGAIPVSEALSIARQIADALATAHEAGIVHRDLKPANIKVRDDGTVKVLDFGLAKGTPDGSSGGDSAATRTSPAMTAMGVILGTASYMSPEQAKGKAVDRRADVWAFGVVLYEMLTGRFLFGREDVTDTLAAVLTHEPDLTKLPASTPPAIKRLLLHCLAKDKHQRLDSMAAARIEIDDVLGGKVSEPASVAPAPSASTGWLRAAAWLAGGVAVGLLASIWWARPAPEPAPRSSLVARITAPLETISAFHDGFALSADGSRLAFAARDTSGLRQIWVRKLDRDAAQPIPGTDGGLYPFWSADSGSIAFLADSKLRRVDENGARLQTICDAPGSDFRGSWNTRDEILFATVRGEQTRVLKVSANGGTPEPLERLGLAFAPVWLTDGRHFLYAAFEETNKVELRLSSVDGQASQVIAPLTRGTQEFAYGGGVLFLNKNDALTAQRLDTTGTLVGTPVPIAHIAGNPKDWFAVSSNGDRVVALVREAPAEIGDPGDPMARLIWVDRQGNTIGSLGDSGRYWTLRLAPDGVSAVVNPGNDLWLLRPDGRHVRLTTGGIARQSVGPIWNRDGSEIIYIERGDIVRRKLDPQSPVVRIEGARGTPQDWSADGRWLLTAGRATPSSTTADLIVYDFANKTARPWLATEFTEGPARFSTDGTWVAYASNVSGRQEVYVRPFAGDAQAIAVSADGGSHPLWRRDGGELYFLSPGDDVMAVTLTRSGTSITPGKPQRLFRIPLNDITRRSWAPYAVTADGQRFLLNVPDRPTPLFFLQGLPAIVK
jgi:eukaryotic-like serine/threonine-protein kinase